MNQEYNWFSHWFPLPFPRLKSSKFHQRIHNKKQYPQEKWKGWMKMTINEVVIQNSVDVTLCNLVVYDLLPRVVNSGCSHASFCFWSGADVWHKVSSPLGRGLQLTPYRSPNNPKAELSLAEISLIAGITLSNGKWEFCPLSNADAHLSRSPTTSTLRCYLLHRQMLPYIHSQWLLGWVLGEAFPITFQTQGRGFTLTKNISSSFGDQKIQEGTLEKKHRRTYLVCVARWKAVMK